MTLDPRGAIAPHVTDDADLWTPGGRYREFKDTQAPGAVPASNLSGVPQPNVRSTPGGFRLSTPGGYHTVNCVQHGSPPRMATDSDRVTLPEAIDRLAAAVKRNDDVVLELYQRLEPVLAADGPRKCDDEAGKASASIPRPCSVVLRLTNLIAELDQSFGRCLELCRRLEL